MTRLAILRSKLNFLFAFTPRDVKTNFMNHQNEIPEFRRQAYFRIINDYAEIHPITLRLYFLDEHFPLDKLDIALQWLIDNRIIGRQFLLWFEQECKNSDLEMHRKLLTIVDNIKALPVVVARKNFRV